MIEDSEREIAELEKSIEQLIQDIAQIRPLSNEEIKQFYAKLNNDPFFAMTAKEKKALIVKYASALIAALLCGSSVFYLIIGPYLGYWVALGNINLFFSLVISCAIYYISYQIGMLFSDDGVESGAKELEVIALRRIDSNKISLQITSTQTTDIGRLVLKYPKFAEIMRKHVSSKNGFFSQFDYEYLRIPSLHQMNANLYLAEFRLESKMKKRDSLLDAVSLGEK